MNLSERIVWDIVDEFAKNKWLNDDAVQKWDNSHICIKTINPIAKKVEKRFKEMITKKIMEIIFKEN